VRLAQGLLVTPASPRNALPRSIERDDRRGLRREHRQCTTPPGLIWFSLVELHHSRSGFALSTYFFWISFNLRP